RAGDDLVLSGVSAEERDLIEVSRARRLVGDAEPFFWREAQHADLALREVAVDLVRGFAGLVERVDLRQRRMYARLADQPVRFPGLAVVREVTTLERLQVHPEVAVVVLDLEARCRRAGDDHPAAFRD